MNVPLSYLYNCLNSSSNVSRCWPICRSASSITIVVGIARLTLVCLKASRNAPGCVTMKFVFVVSVGLCSNANSDWETLKYLSRPAVSLFSSYSCCSWRVVFGTIATTFRGTALTRNGRNAASVFPEPHGA